MTLHPRRTTATAVAILLAVCSTTVRADTWSGGTGNQNWNTTANWTPAVPNGEGAVAIFAPTAETTVAADTSAATTVTFGALTNSVNLNINLGQPNLATADQGFFVIDGAGTGPATIGITGISSAGRGVHLSGSKMHHFTLASDLIVNCVGAAVETRATFQVRGNAATVAQPALQGNGYTVTLNGGQLMLATSGYNQYPATNVTFDVRNAKFTNGGSLSQVEAVSTAGNGYKEGYNLRVIIGTPAGQRYAVGSSGTIGADLLLAGPTTIINSGGRTFSLTGKYSDYSGTNQLSLIHTDTTSRSVTFSGSFTNTYAGGTYVDYYNSTTSAGSHTLNLNKAGALGTGPVTVNRLATLSFGASFALGTSNTASSNAITFTPTCGLTTLALATYTQSLRSVKVGTTALVPGTYTASQLETALETAGLPASLTVTGTTGTWIILPPPPPAQTVVLVR